jgi:hypothetical protein
MLTEYALMGAAAFLLAVEAWALKAPADNARLITHVVKDWARDYPILPFAIGVLMGHLFW